MTTDIRDIVRKTQSGRCSVAAGELPDELIDPAGYRVTWERVCDAAVAAGFARGALEAPAGYSHDYEPDALYVTGVSKLRKRTAAKVKRAEKEKLHSMERARKREVHEESRFQNACKAVVRRMQFYVDRKPLRVPGGITTHLVRRIVEIANAGSEDDDAEDACAALDSMSLRERCSISDEELWDAVKPYQDDDTWANAGWCVGVSDGEIARALLKHWRSYLQRQEDCGGCESLDEIRAIEEQRELERLREDQRRLLEDQ